jgi:hypothetical protein
MAGTLNGEALTKARVQLGAWGLWWADVAVAGDFSLAVGSPASVVIGEVPMAGTVVSGGPFEGTASYRIVGGRGGWGRTLQYQGYRDDAGVRASKIIADLANASGEILKGALPTSRLGSHFARVEGPAYLMLGRLAPSSWYVDLDGSTVIGSRPSSTYSGDAPRVHVDKNAQMITLAVEGSIAGLVPGVVVDGMSPASDVEYELTPDSLIVRVWGGAGAAKNRRIAALRKIVGQELRYFPPTEFRVVTQSGNRLNLQVVRKGTGFGDLSGVPMRPGIAGWKGNVALGENVLVWFVEGDPSRPVVVAHDDPDAPGWMPLTIELGGPSALGVARIGDTVQAGPYAGVITSGSARVKASV